MGETLVLEGSSRVPVANGTPVGSLPAAVSTEIDDYLRLIQTFGSCEPDEVLRQVSAVSARLTYLRIQLIREGNQRANRVRTQELDPLMDNLDMQFKIASRLLTVRQLDWDMAKGGT